MCSIGNGRRRSSGRAELSILGVVEHPREESTVTLTFKKHGEDSLMTLMHSDLPDHELARGHEKGWNYFLEIFRE